MKLLKDLHRRRVFRLAGLYIVGAWVVIEFASVFFPAWGIPDTALRFLFIAAALLFPVALIFSWVFDITSAGIVRTKPAAPGEDLDISLRRSDYLILAALAIVGISVLAGSFQRIAQEVETNPIATAAAKRIENSIAVLPFTNLDANPDTGYFSDGVTEEILHRLSSLDALHVLGRTSSFAFRESSDGPARIGELLGVEYLLQGSVRRDANIVRVTARLLDESGLQVWSESFDRKLEGIFTIQAEIASMVASEIASEIIPLQENPLARTTTNMEAYNHYLVGRAFLNSRTPGWQQEAEASFRDAIALDPDYAPPYAGLAVTLMISEVQNDEVEKEAFDAAARSIELDPDLAEAHAAMGLALLARREPDHVAATVSLRHSLSLDPSLTIAYNWLSSALNQRGLTEESAQVQDEGLAIDPLNPSLSVNIAGRESRKGNTDYAEQLLMRLTYLPDPPGLVYWELMELYTQSGRYDKAAEVAKETIRAYSDTDNTIAIAALTWTYLRLGMVDEANYWSQWIGQLTKNPVRRYLLTTYTNKLLGDVDAVARDFEELRASMPDPSRLPPFIRAVFAASYMAINKPNEAIAIFESAFGESGLGALDSLDPLDAYDFMHQIVYAYRQVGRDESAARTLAAIDEHINGWMGEIESAYPPGLEALALNRLQQGEYELAYEALAAAINKGWANYRWISMEPSWAAALERREFKALVAPVQKELERQRSLAQLANAEHDFHAEFEALYDVEPTD